jgi:hypothetical protein
MRLVCWGQHGQYEQQQQQQQEEEEEEDMQHICDTCHGLTSSLGCAGSVFTTSMHGHNA